MASKQDLVSFSFDAQDLYDQDAPLLIDAEEPSRYLTLRSYQVLVESLIAGFNACGFSPGECVLTHIPNSYFYPAIFFSIIGAGGIWCGSNTANQVFELSHYISISAPRFIITEAEQLPIVLAACKEHNIPASRIFVLDPEIFPGLSSADSTPSPSSSGRSTPSQPETGVLSFNRLLQYGTKQWRTFSTSTEAQETPAVYFATSGTTGLPKLASVCHSALIHQHRGTYAPFPFVPRRLIALPLGHAFGFGNAFVHPSRYGWPTYIMRRFRLQPYLDNIKRFDITEVYATPPILVAILPKAIQPEDNTIELLSSVRYLGVAGAPISASVINTFRALLSPEATVSNQWGMTEHGTSLLFRHGENDTTGSVGRFITGYEGKVVDASGETLPEGGSGEGELIVKTKGKMMGYLGHPKHEDEWWATGDLARIIDGKVYIIGRIKELIKVRGWQVAPAELETVLLQHKGIVDAAVMGVIGSDGGEVPRAYVVRQDQKQESKKAEGSMNTGGNPVPTEAEVYRWARERLASYKALDGGVIFVDSIPKTPSGKILRRKLLELEVR